jgi:hypothetical protein
MQFNAASNVPTSQISSAHAIAGIQWLHDMSSSAKWDLSAEEVADLLGGVPLRTYHDLKRKALAGQSISLNRDCLERISLLLGISKALQLIAPSGRSDMAYQWFNTPNDNPIFENKSIKQYLLDRKSIEGLYTVRRYLDAARG